MSLFRRGIALGLALLIAALALTGCQKPQAEPTALSVMEQFNTAQPISPTDKYRNFYEVFVYSFADSNGDGIGDLKGLTEKLDYISDLGCNALWLMPIMPSPTYHKYDVTDYYAIDPAYGTLEDFKALVDACHERGMTLIMDLVLNHTSSQHPWFQEAATYLKELPQGQEPDPAAQPLVNYYNFAREGKTGWSPLTGTDFYYESIFWSEMPDLNLDNPDLRQEIEKIVQYWLDLGADGFRLDAVKDYYTGNSTATVEFLSWFNDTVKAIDPDAYLVGEVWAETPAIASYYASGVDSFFNFGFADNGGVISTILKKENAASYGNMVLYLQDTLAPYPQAIDAPFYANHDMGRSAGYYPGETGEVKTKLGLALNQLMSGASFLYYGEELGMKGSGKDENKRAPMYWTADGSAPETCQGPKDMDSFEMKFPALDSQQEDGNSIYHLVRQALRLRSSYPEISHGQTAVVDTGSPDSFCLLEKSWQDQKCWLAINLAAEPVTLDVSGLGAGTIGGALLTDPSQPSLKDGSLTVPGNSILILK